MATVFAVVLDFGQARGQYVGVYRGILYVKNEGVVNLPETSSGVTIFTIAPDGAIREGLNVTAGPTMGSVAANGTVTFSPPLAGSQIATATFINGVMNGTNTLDFGALRQTYRIEATKIGEVGEDTEPSISFLTPPRRSIRAKQPVCS